MSRPPRASTRPRRPSRSVVEPIPGAVISNVRVSTVSRTWIDVGAPAPAPSERVEPRQVDRHHGLRRVAAGRGHVDPGRNARSGRGRAKQCGQVARFERRRVDPLREPRRLLEPVVHGTGHLGEERRQRGGIRVLGLPGELQAHSERDQVLVDAVVKVTLDRATICVCGQDESPPRGAKLLELHPQSVEIPLHVDLPSPQRNHLPPPYLGSSPSSRCPASSGPASLADGGGHRARSPAATVGALVAAA